MAGASTGAVLAARAGPGAMITGSLVGGFLLGLIEGAQLLIARIAAPGASAVNPVIEHKPRPPPLLPTNRYGMIRHGQTQKISSEIGFSDQSELDAEDRF
jgi:hypothetical protein